MADSREPENIQPMLESLPNEMTNILTQLPVEDHHISSLPLSQQDLNFQSSHYEDRMFFFKGRDGCLYFSDLEISNTLHPKKVNFVRYDFEDIVGSCNGLLLCTCHVDGKSSLVLINPSTSQHKVISIIEPTFLNKITSLGFGYDSRADDYKVVKIVPREIEQGKPPSYEVGVYSFKSNSWKILEDFTGGMFSFVNGVVINNHMLHWLLNTNNDSHAIWSFDVCTEQWSQVPLPPFDERRMPMNINVFDGRLCLLIHGLDSGLFVMDALSVKDPWVKLFDCSGPSGTPLFGSYLPYPLFYSKSGMDIFLVVRSSLYWYNLTQKSCRKVQNDTDISLYAQFIVCTRTLAHLPSCG